MKKKLLASALTTLAVGASVTALPVTPAEAALGQRSLATVLAADGHHFDRKWRDFDILDLERLSSAPADGGFALYGLSNGVRHGGWEERRCSCE